jgi:hypothetical protein
LPSVLPPSSPLPILLANALYNRSPSMLMLIWCMCDTIISHMYSTWQH